MTRFGYNTNGLAHHRPEEAVALIGDAGFTAVALTPDVGALDPLAPDAAALARVRRALEQRSLAVAIETGARFVLDPARKHRPTLLEADASERARRRTFLRGCMDLAGELGAEVVSIWSGAAPPDAPAATLDDAPDHPLGPRLAEELARVLDDARVRGVRVAFEPEPGMFVERVRGFEALLGLMGSAGDGLALTLDTGHCSVTDDLPVSRVLGEVAPRLAHVHLADCPRGEHVHLPLGDGDLDLQDVVRGLEEIAFRGIAAVECSRDSHRGPSAVAHAMAVLRPILTGN